MMGAAAAVSPAALPGWPADDHAAAFAAWRLTSREAPQVRDARTFFETRFRAASRPCHFTGYYEPELSGRLVSDPQFCHALFAPPPDLAVGRPWYSRAEIVAGDLLSGQEIVWLDSAIEAFLAQVQGSARIRLPGGQVLRLGFAAKNGHPYRSIGQELIRRGEIAPDAISADAIRAWCARHPDAVPGLLVENPSFVFFRVLDLPADSGPIGASGAPLTALRSLAADASHVPPGAPVWVECGSIKALFVAQDIGSAIRGPSRADLFCGSGAAAGNLASGLNTRGTMHVFHPSAAG